MKFSVMYINYNKMNSILTYLKYFAVFVIIAANLCLIMYRRVAYVREQRRQFLQNYYDERDNNLTAEEFLDEHFKEALHLVDNILHYKYQIKLVNDKQKILNTNLYGPVRKGTTVIVIQVHDNAEYLKALVDSLRNVAGIMRALLIFSHDYFDYDINRIVRNVSFAKYMQIFYPYSVQLHPKIYPGPDSEFCSEGFQCEKNQSRRDEVLAQKKLFWWWQTRHVFEELGALVNFNKSIIFLEEQDIVTEDFIYVHKFLAKLMLERCPQCEMLSLGAYQPLLTHYHIQNGYVVVSGWNSAIRNLGMAFNRTVWNMIKLSAIDFCYHNDYNWDRSLRHVASRRSHNPFWIMSITGPRVFRVEDCDIDDVACNMQNMIEKVQRYIKMIKRALYPRNMIITFAQDGVGNVTGAGAFDDIRDQELCMYLTRDR